MAERERASPSSGTTARGQWQHAGAPLAAGGNLLALIAGSHSITIRKM